MDLYKGIYQSIHEYVRKLTPDPGQQEEVTQTVIIKIYESIDTLRDHQKLTAASAVRLAPAHRLYDGG